MGKSGNAIVFLTPEESEFVGMTHVPKTKPRNAMLHQCAFFVPVVAPSVRALYRCALVFLSAACFALPSPDATFLAEFLSVKKVPIAEYSKPENVEIVTETIKQAAKLDREIYMSVCVTSCTRICCAYVFQNLGVAVKIIFHLSCPL